MAGERTILTVHRELHARLRDWPNAEVRRLLGVAFAMGKKIDNKLRQYRLGQSVEWYAANKMAGGELDGVDDRPDVGFGK